MSIISKTITRFRSLRRCSKGSGLPPSDHEHQHDINLLREFDRSSDTSLSRNSTHSEGSVSDLYICDRYSCCRIFNEIHVLWRDIFTDTANLHATILKAGELVSLLNDNNHYSSKNPDNFHVKQEIADRCFVYVSDAITFSLAPPKTTEQTEDYAGITSMQLFIAPPITKRFWPSHRLRGKLLEIPTTKTPEPELKTLLKHLKNKKKELEEVQRYFDLKLEKHGQWNRWKEEVLAKQRVERIAIARVERRRLNCPREEVKDSNEWKLMEYFLTATRRQGAAVLEESIDSTSSIPPITNPVDGQENEQKGKAKETVSPSDDRHASISEPAVPVHAVLHRPATVKTTVNTNDGAGNEVKDSEMHKKDSVISEHCSELVIASGKEDAEEGKPRGAVKNEETQSPLVDG